MNRKGFTLIELLAVIVILGIILVFVTPNILEVYKNSKLKSEEIFVDRVSLPIDSYIKLKTDDIVFTKVEGTFTKTYIDSTGNEKVDYPNIYIGKIQEKTENGEYILKDITINDIINTKLLFQENYINAGNKGKPCNNNAIIEVYKDSDYVYCYKVKKASLGCLTEDYKTTLNGDYAIDTCLWEEVR